MYPKRNTSAEAASSIRGWVRKAMTAQTAGTNSMVSKEDVDALDGFVQPGDIAVVQLEMPIAVVEYGIRFCSERGAYVILNAAPASEISEEALRTVDLLIVNELEAGFYCRTKIDSMQKAKAEILSMTERLNHTCIFTLGKAGSVVCENGRCEERPSKKVQAVEATGAGDSFIGGLCCALLGGMDIFEAARFATCCSAKTVCKTGGQPAMPVLDEVMELYRA